VSSTEPKAFDTNASTTTALFAHGGAYVCFV
jgi:hypothetical protein